MKNTTVRELTKTTITLIYSTDTPDSGGANPGAYPWEIKTIGKSITQEEYVRLLNGIDSEIVMFADGGRMALSGVNGVLHNYQKDHSVAKNIGYWKPVRKKSPWGGFRNQWRADRDIVDSPFLIGRKADFLKAYAGESLSGNMVQAIGYSLQKNQEIRFSGIEAKDLKPSELSDKERNRFAGNYAVKIPFNVLASGSFFRGLFRADRKVERNMVFRMLMFLFVGFTFIYMPFISRDYGISGDEFVDQRHSGYVIDYFTKGDSAALYQPKTALHLYGIGVQVVAEAICRVTHTDDIYMTRHAINGIVGALGILMTGLLAMRWGGGLCGLLAVLMMFFTPRYFGHSMNNLKDLPFAVGYIMSLYYFIRLFDRYPYFKWRHVLGAVVGLFLSLGTRSGGLMLFPCLVMYGGLFYIQKVGIREFYKFGRYGQDIARILNAILLVIVAGYIVSILLWPYALEKPFTGVTQSLKQFTNFSVSLRTIFEGKQMMSSMLPWNYAPKYLLIGVPLVTVVGFFAYWFYTVIRRKEFSLISFFLLFTAVFPVFWVIYKNSNLYGGIRHLLFVMPVMVVVAARFWSLMMERKTIAVKVAAVAVWLGLLCLPVIHMVKNHPNDYVYFNESVGGLKHTYGDYETDYYYNSLKNSTDWFKKNILKGKDDKVVIATNHIDILRHYFRHYPNVRIVYSRYYEKYSKDWDYGIFANVYINRFQLKTGLFPPKNTIYSSDVDGFPMSVVLKRQSKKDFEGVELERQRKYDEALQVFTEYIREYPDNEEVLSHMAKIYYLVNDLPQSEKYAQLSLKLHPSLNETLYVLAMVYINQNKTQEALATAQRILDENSLSADGYYLKAMAYHKMKDYKNSVDLLNKALSYRPTHAGALSLAGDIMMKTGNFKVGADIYQKLLKQSKDIRYMTALADCYCRLKEYQKMDQLLGQVNQAQPAYFPAYKVLLRKFIQEKELPQAQQLLKIMEEVEADSELCVLRALYEHLRNNTGAVAMYLKQALELDPDNGEAQQLQKMVSGNVNMRK